MMQEESRMRMHAEPNGPLGVRSALTALRSGMTGAQGETHMCYNYKKIGHMIKVYPKSPNERDAGGRRQSRNCERGRTGQKGGRGDNQANLMVAKEEKQAIVGLSEEDLIMEIVRRRQKGARSEGKSAVADTLALASISTTRSSDWIVDSGASRHVTGAAKEFSSYTHLAVPYSIQTTDGTVQPVVGKGTVRCTDLVTLTNVLHAPSFSVKLVSISAIIREQKCIVTFDIPKMIFQEKGTGQILRTGTWHDELWYMDRKGMDTALSSVVDRVGQEDLG